MPRAATAATPASKRAPPAAKVTSTEKRPRGRPSNASKLAVAAQIAVDLGKLVNQYDAAGQGRRMQSWKAPGTGPNQALKGLQTLRNRARDSSRNDWTGASSLRRWTTNLIGTGISARFNKIKAEGTREKYAELFADWCEECDADGVNNFFAMETLATRAWIESGEVFARLRQRRANFGMKVPLQVQLLEADMVPLLDVDNYYPDMPRGNRIRSGIELDPSGQRAAYWIYKEHPGDMPATLDRNQLIRVPASQMIHVFETLRPGQLRGVPDNAAILTRLRNVLDYEDAALERQKLANLFLATIEKAGVSGVYDGTDPLTGLPIKASSADGPAVTLEPGVVHELLPGEKLNFTNPPEAGTAYGEYMRSQNLGTAAGSGMPYELMSGDIYNIQDRTLRIVIQEFRRYCEQRQWQTIIPKFCVPILKAFVATAAVMGEIAMADVDACRRAEWQPHGWAYIHPTQDVEARAKEVEAGFRSRDSVIAERGDDPQKVDQERKLGKDREDKLDLTPEPVAAPGVGAKPGAPAGKPKPTNEVMPQFEASLSRLETLVATIQAAAARAPQNEPPQQLHVHAHIAAPTVAVTNNVEPTPVTINTPEVIVTNNVDPTPITVTAPNVQVNVDPTPITVTAPNVAITNEVQPATVVVELPTRETKSVIKRDAMGNIIDVKQVESTVNH